MVRVNVAEAGGWAAAIREAVARRGERDALARDGQQIFIISPTTEQEEATDD